MWATLLASSAFPSERFGFVCAEASASICKEQDRAGDVLGLCHQTNAYGKVLFSISWIFITIQILTFSRFSKTSALLSPRGGKKQKENVQPSLLDKATEHFKPGGEQDPHNMCPRTREQWSPHFLYNYTLLPVHSPLFFITGCVIGVEVLGGTG